MISFPPRERLNPFLSRYNDHSLYVSSSFACGKYLLPDTKPNIWPLTFTHNCSLNCLFLVSFSLP